MTEARASDRQRMFVQGRLLFGGGALSAVCYVRDLSPTGARVTVDPGVTLPNRMTLQIPSKSVAKEAEVRWRHGDVLGLEFEKTPDASNAAPDDLARRIRELEDENAVLRQKLRDLRIELANRLSRDEATN